MSDRNNPSTAPPAASVLIKKTSTFEKSKKGLINAQEERGLELLLGDNPMLGKPVRGEEGVLEIADYCGCVITYVRNLDATVVWLLLVQKNDAEIGPGTKDEQDGFKDILKDLRKAGIVWAGKKLLDWIWEVIKGLGS